MSGTVENMLRLARESDAATRAMLARNATTPHEVLAFLAKDEEPRVRASVIANSRAPFSVLKCLSTRSPGAPCCGYASLAHLLIP